MFGSIIGIIIGVGGMFAAQQLIPTATDESATNEQKVVGPKPETSVESGLGLTPPQMYDELQELPAGEEFEQTYLNYMLLMRNNETAMHRLAVDKSPHDELKLRASLLMDENRILSNDMVTWQKIWGYTHH